MQNKWQEIHVMSFNKKHCETHGPKNPSFCFLNQCVFPDPRRCTLPFAFSRHLVFLRVMLCSLSLSPHKRKLFRFFRPLSRSEIMLWGGHYIHDASSPVWTRQRVLQGMVSCSLVKKLGKAVWGARKRFLHLRQVYGKLIFYCSLLNFIQLYLGAAVTSEVGCCICCWEDKLISLFHEMSFFNKKMNVYHCGRQCLPM